MLGLSFVCRCCCWLPAPRRGPCGCRGPQCCIHSRQRLLPSALGAMRIPSTAVKAHSQIVMSALKTSVHFCKCFEPVWICPVTSVSLSVQQASAGSLLPSAAAGRCSRGSPQSWAGPHVSLCFFSPRELNQLGLNQLGLNRLAVPRGGQKHLQNRSALLKSLCADEGSCV